MKKIRVMIAAVTLLLLSFSFCFAASSIVKEYEFYSNTKEYRYAAPKEIKEGGKIYKLTSIEFELLKERAEKTEKIRTADKDDYPRIITYMDKTLIAESDITWIENSRTPKIIQKTYDSNADIPDSIPIEVSLEHATDEDNQENKEKVIDATAKLTDTTQQVVRRPFTAPAVFYGVEGSAMYDFNGKIIKVNGTSPTWPDYETDVKAYLGLNSASEISGGSWTSGYLKDGQITYRTASYSGTYLATEYVATFTETEDTIGRYEAEVRYLEDGMDGKYLVKAICIYERSGLHPIIKIGAGILAAAMAAAAILFIIRRRRGDEDE